MVSKGDDQVRDVRKAIPAALEYCIYRSHATVTKIVYPGLVITFEIRDVKIMALLIAYLRERDKELDARDDQSAEIQARLDTATAALKTARQAVETTLNKEKGDS